MSESKTIKGNAWINKDTLYQEQILVIPGKDCITNVVVLIENIWDDLLSDSGTYKTNGKGYFYWEYEMTDTENDDIDVTIKLECPRPKEGILKEPYNPDSETGKYAKYWAGKYKTAQENYEDKAAIQRKEITFQGSNYVNQNGEIVEVEEQKVKNNDIGDITNLLSLF